MKKISIATLLLACTLTSCSLDILPENAQTYDTSFNNEAGVNSATASVEYFLNIYAPTNNTFTTVGIFADTLQDVSVHAKSSVAMLIFFIFLEFHVETKCKFAV